MGGAEGLMHMLYRGGLSPLSSGAIFTSSSSRWRHLLRRRMVSTTATASATPDSIAAAEVRRATRRPRDPPRSCRGGAGPPSAPGSPQGTQTPPCLRYRRSQTHRPVAASQVA